MQIANFKPFVGQHCETTATGTLLRQIGIEFSEPMLFGLGEGLGFIFWNMKTMPFPFIGGRVKTDRLTENIARNLKLDLTVQETGSHRKAWQGVKDLLDAGQTVGLKLDCFHLEYFTNPIHFAGHYTAIYGYDDQNAYLVDTAQQGGQVKTSLKSLESARAEKGPMASKNLYYTIQLSGAKYDLKNAIITAIRNNAIAFLNPPITNIGYKGILKTSSEIVNWFKNSKDIENEFKTAARLMEKAGTGGALFRNLYRDFLAESYLLLSVETLQAGHEAFAETARLWTIVAALFDKVSETQDIRYLLEAADILKAISAKERMATVMLANL